MKKGYIAIWRKIKDHPFATEKRVFSKYEAWLDILMEAQHCQKPKEVILGMTPLECNYGESLKSIRTWGRRWDWSPSKVKRFLVLLEKMKQIHFKNEIQTTRITVCNYKHYDPKMEQERTNPEPRPNTDKNEKNVKKNNIHCRVVDYLNRKTNASYKPWTKTTRQLIDARVNEGFQADDFKTVIDFKCKQWGGDGEMQEYLRPLTLFSNKFEGYLNAAKRENSDTPINKETAEEINKRLGL